MKAKTYSRAEVYNLLCGIFNTATAHDDDACAGIDGDPLDDCSCGADTDGGDLIDELALAIEMFRPLREHMVAVTDDSDGHACATIGCEGKQCPCDGAPTLCHSCGQGAAGER